MPSILQNVTAQAASRQIGINQMGLKRAIERLTTGKRVNRASDDAAGMAAGTQAEAAARKAKESVKAQQVTYFQAQAADGYFEEATNLAYRLAELEGGGNTAASEYTAIQALIGSAWSQGVATYTAVTAAYTTAASAATITAIQIQRDNYAKVMATANSTANLNGISAENNFSISDTWLGADIGSETVQLTKYQILMQAGTNALSNANQSSQIVLSLLR